ncbi:MAG: HDIG domain-containing metalloprotein [bacterium]
MGPEAFYGPLENVYEVYLLTGVEPLPFKNKIEYHLQNIKNSLELADNYKALVDDATSSIASLLESHNPLHHLAVNNWLYSFDSYDKPGSEAFIHSLVSAHIAGELAKATIKPDGIPSFTSEDIDSIRAGMLLHDIGKTQCPEFVNSGAVDFGGVKLDAFKAEHIKYTIEFANKNHIEEDPIMYQVMVHHHQQPDGEGHPKFKTNPA